MLSSSRPRRGRPSGRGEVPGGNGYSITQFSPPPSTTERRVRRLAERRARFPLESARDAEGDRRRLPPPVKISAIDDGKALFPGPRRGQTLEASIQGCKWLVEAGVDGLTFLRYVFPHPRTRGGTSRSQTSRSSFDTRLSAVRTPQEYLMSGRRRSTRPSRGVGAAVRQLGGRGHQALARQGHQAVVMGPSSVPAGSDGLGDRRGSRTGSTDGVTIGHPADRHPDLPNLSRQASTGAQPVHVLQQG